jgi:hypothetical protein
LLLLLAVVAKFGLLLFGVCFSPSFFAVVVNTHFVVVIAVYYKNVVVVKALIRCRYHCCYKLFLVFVQFFCR